MSEAICRGAWMLGTACGHCSRCMDEASRLIPKLREEIQPNNIKVSKLAAALSLAPRPTKTPNAEWMIDYMDWFFQTRGNVMSGK